MLPHTSPSTPSHPAPTASEPAGGYQRQRAVRQARALNRFSIAWNVVEGMVAVAAGVAAGSVSLIGFGLDSGIEVSASVILAWRLHREKRGGCMANDDRRATRAIAVSFAALAVWLWVEATRQLVTSSEPDPTVAGIALAGLSLLTMPVLARAKRRLAPALGSRAAVSEANQTALCALMSGVLLAGLALNALAGWAWSDSIAGLGIGAIAAFEAVRTWRADALADTCCA